MAEKFAEGGYDLVLCSRSEKAIKETAEALAQRFPKSKVFWRTADLAEKEQAKAFAKWILEEELIPDVLINNAGQFIPGSVYNEAEGALEQMMDTNLYSAYHLSRGLLPAMMERKKGHIFNICSIASLQAYANGGAYSISKFALAGFSKNLREEMKPHGIKVTAVYPGATYTDSWADSGIDPQRIMEAGDIADLVYTASRLSNRAVVEDLIIRPQLGDL
jgi:short-subunit dehydrogenase